MAEGAKIHGLPEEGRLFNLSEFKGINTKSPRMAIDDQEMSWCENMFPIAPGNLRTMYGIGTSIYTAPVGRTVVYIFFYNIGATQYCAVFLDNGTAFQINVGTHASTTISNTANTFYRGSTLPACVQYGNKYLLIANTGTANDYWIWDGAILYKSGSLSPAVNLTQGGNNYTGTPSVAVIGGSGGGVSITATVTNGSVTALNITNPGSGFLIGNNIQLQFTGGSPDPGQVIAVNVINGGDGYATVPNITISGGGGASATATAVLTNGVVTGVTVTAGGTGFTGTPTVTFDSGTAVAHAVVDTVADGTVSLMPFGNSGNALEVFLNRVFLANSAKVQITDPESLTAFNTTLTSTDSFLKNQFNGLKQTNGFLYLLADSSVNDVSNVSTSGSPSITTLNNSNADPQVGTPWRDSIVPFGRDIIFANTNGIYAMYGSAAVKVSDQLDGIFATATLPITGNNYPSAAFATIFGIKVYMLLITCIDAFTGQSAKKLMCWDGKKWFIASQEVDFTFIASQEVSSQLTAWGTDGSGVYPMFQAQSDTLTKKGKSKLWPGESYLIFKQALRAYLESFANTGTTVSISITIDNETDSTQAIPLTGGNLLEILNGGSLYYITNGGNNYSIISGGIGIQGVDAPQYGRLMGFTFTTTSKDFTMVTLSLLYKNQTLYG